MSDRVVDVRVEFFARRAEFLDAQLFKHRGNIFQDQLYSLGELFALVILRGALQIVENRQKLAHAVADRVGVKGIALLTGAAAEIIVFRKGAQILVGCVRALLFLSLQLLFKLGDFRLLLFGAGIGFVSLCVFLGALLFPVCGAVLFTGAAVRALAALSGRILRPSLPV